MGARLVDVYYIFYDLGVMWMVCPFQVHTLQGHTLGTGCALAGNETRNARGWQQSRENRAVSTVAGQHT